MSDSRYLIQLLLAALRGTGTNDELCRNASQWLKDTKDGEPKPRAKALVWSEKSYEWISGEYYVSKPQKFAQFDGVRMGDFYAIDDAKAACESHHQARFLEQLA